jgi:hypothetical protein
MPFIIKIYDSRDETAYQEFCDFKDLPRIEMLNRLSDFSNLYRTSIHEFISQSIIPHEIATSVMNRFNVRYEHAIRRLDEWNEKSNFYVTLPYTVIAKHDDNIDRDASSPYIDGLIFAIEKRNLGKK